MYLTLVLWCRTCFIAAAHVYLQFHVAIVTGTLVHISHAIVLTSRRCYNNTHTHTHTWPLLNDVTDCLTSYTCVYTHVTRWRHRQCTHWCSSKSLRVWTRARWEWRQIRQTRWWSGASGVGWCSSLSTWHWHRVRTCSGRTPTSTPVVTIATHTHTHLVTVTIYTHAIIGHTQFRNSVGVCHKLNIV